MEKLSIRIGTNLEKVNEQIELAASSAGRSSKDVKLVVVTKSRPTEMVQAAVNAGVKILGENYPEESLEKIRHITNAESVEWHMIGHLQKRKLPIVVSYFTMMHSVDHLSIAERLNSSLCQAGKRMTVLLEMNVGGEETKFGWPAADKATWVDLLPDMEKLINYSNLEVRGLMTMPPLSSTVDESREHFIRLRGLQEFLAARFQSARWDELSMGTSHDFETAIQEGATYIRLGQAIFFVD